MASDHGTPLQIKRLFLVSGPSCVGKTTFLERVKLSSLLRFRLGLEYRPSWVSSSADLRRLVGMDGSPYLVPCLYESRSGHLFVTYDHNMRWILSRWTYAGDPGLRELLLTREIVLVTMWEHPTVLRHRCDGRIRASFFRLARLRRFRKQVHRLRLHVRMRAFYARPSELWVQYCEWFAFCSAYDPVDHWVVRSTEPDRIAAWSEHSEPLWERTS